MDHQSGPAQLEYSQARPVAVASRSAVRRSIPVLDAVPPVENAAHDRHSTQRSEAKETGCD